MNRVSFIIAYSLSHVLIFLLFGCRDTNINPYETDTGIYSIYGAVDMDKAKHLIRVRDLNVFHQDSSSINLDATVTFYDVKNGTSQVLRDSIVQFPENYTHNFILNKKVEVRSPYRVTVERSDGLSVASNFTTPGITETHIFPFFGPHYCFRELEITFRNVLPTEQIRWEIGFEYNNITHWRELTNHCKQSYDAERNELVIMVNPLNLLNTIFPKFMDNDLCNGLDPDVVCDELDSNKVRIRYLHLGPEWGSIFPVKPPDPANVGDVENGLGFLGAFRRDSLSFQVIQD